MIQYFDGNDTACIDGYSFRKDKQTGYFLSSKKIGEKRERLHVYIWKKYNGEVKKGYHIHHIDKDKNNNGIENLIMVTSSEHAKLHSDWSEERKSKARNNLIKNAVPKSKEWHRSEEGIAWHRRHAKEVAKNLKPISYECTNCGKTFDSKKRFNQDSNKFCSNACKSAFRRKMGYDNVEKFCEECGKTYVENKYTKSTKCKICRNKKH